MSRRVAAILLGAAAAGCSSAGGPAPAVDTAPAGPPIVQPGDGYVMYYADGSGVRLRDTRAVADSVVIPGARDVVAKPSPDNGAVAVAYRQGSAASLVLIDAASGAVSTVHTAAGGGSYTFTWAPGSDALGAGFRPAGAGQSAVLIADRRGNVRNVGCSASDRFVAWRANGQIVVGDRRNIYTVSARDCSTLATLPMNGKTEITYSPDGARVVFKRGNSLFIAAHDGTGTRQIVAARSRPTNLRWSPDSRKIAFEIRSPRYGNVTHVAVYDYATGQATFNAEEKPLGVPTDNNPCWAPDGGRLSIDRAYRRRGESGDYVQQQKVVTNVAGDDETVVDEELIRGELPEGRGECAWVDDQHLALMSADGPKIFNVDTKVAYRMPPNAKLLYAQIAN